MKPAMLCIVCLLAPVTGGSLFATEQIDTSQLIKGLSSRYLDERNNAIAAALELPEQQRVAMAPKLVELFDQQGYSAWFAQCSAASLLQKMGPAAKVHAPKLGEAILKAIKERDLTLAQIIFQTLKAVNPDDPAPALAGLKSLLDIDDEGIHLATVSFMERIESAQSFIPELLRLAAGSHPRAARKAIEQLVVAQAPTDQLLPIMIGAVTKDEPLLVLAALQAIAMCKEKAQSAVPTLLETLKRDHKQIKLAAIQALGNIGSGAAAAESELTRFLKDSEPDLAESAATALAGIGPRSNETISALATAAGDKGPLSVAAVKALGASTKEALPILEKALQSKDQAQADAAAWALGKLSESEEAAFSLLHQTIKTEKGATLKAAVGAIRMSGEKAQPAVPDLLAAAKGADHAFQEEIQKTLKAIKGENKPPLAQAQDLEAEEGRNVNIELTASDPDDIPLTLTAKIVANPKNGVLKAKSGRTFVYESKMGFVGTDQFEWKAHDGVAESETARVTIQVKPDQTGPKVSSAQSSGSKTRVVVRFDEPVTVESGGDPGNFKIEPELLIQNAKVSQDGLTVTLTTDLLAEKTTYTLTASGVADRSKTGNKGGGASPFTYTPEAPGLWYTYYEETPKGETLEDFGKMVPKDEGSVPNFTLDKKKRNENFSFKFVGFIRIPKDGAYTFYTASDDGSRLYIGDTAVVKNDGMHGKVEKSGQITLAAGLIPITVTFYQGGGGLSLTVHWEGPEIKKQVIPEDVLFYTP